MPPIKPCRIPGCERPKALPKQGCYWHSLLKLDIETQILNARNRREVAEAADGFVYRARVPEKEWPEGERWCSGCQMFVPLFYCSGSRCKAHTSEAAHAGSIERTYGITRKEFELLWEMQGGRCFICRRRLHSKRPAVDHDHETGAVRGLLCADSDRGCNHAILGNISGLDMARRIVEYLEDPPYARLLRQR